jgi:hypothetical protein
MTETWQNRVRLGAQRVIARCSYGLTNYRHPFRTKALEAALCYPFAATTPLECVELYQAVTAAEKIHGDLAEVGVYRGGTAALMLTASAHKRLHLFDTFTGLPHGEGDMVADEWAGSLSEVKRNLDYWNDRIIYHPGLFPVSALGAESLRFSFVHLDVDLYDSTSAALEWFWPRMVPGGILLSHDYPLLDGVVRAFREFFEPRPEPVIALSGNQCLAVRTTAS